MGGEEKWGEGPGRGRNKGNSVEQTVMWVGVGGVKGCFEPWIAMYGAQALGDRCCYRRHIGEASEKHCLFSPIVISWHMTILGLQKEEPEVLSGNQMDWYFLIWFVGWDRSFLAWLSGKQLRTGNFSDNVVVVLVGEMRGSPRLLPSSHSLFPLPLSFYPLSPVPPPHWSYLRRPRCRETIAEAP